jgi:hypothetical protein
VDDCQFGSTLLIILFYFCGKFLPLVNETKGGGANSQKIFIFGYNPKPAIFQGGQKKI